MPSIARLVLTLSVIALALGSSACGASQSSEPKTYAVTKKVGEKLMRVQELAAQKEWQPALDELAKIEASKYLSDHEHARIFQIRAGLLAAQENPPDPVKALEQAAAALEQAVALNALAEEDQLATEFHLGELYIMVERFPDAAETLARWLKHAPKADASGYYLTASAYAQAGRFAEAAPYADEAVSRAKKPQEPWLRLQVSIQYELKQDAAVAAALERLVAAFPSKAEDWLQLAETYAALDQDARSLETLEKAHARGLLTQENQLLRLAQAYVDQKAPAKAGALLDDAFAKGTVAKTPASLDVYARAWIAAGDPEHAAKVLHASAQASGSAETWLLLGRLESEREGWAAAQAALARAIVLGGLRAQGEAQLMLGVALYNQRQVDAAVAAWNEAKKDAASAKEAEHWIGQAKAKSKPSKKASKQ